MPLLYMDIYFIKSMKLNHLEMFFYNEQIYYRCSSQFFKLLLIFYVWLISEIWSV
jgi:hypothetical protein